MNRAVLLGLLLATLLFRPGMLAHSQDQLPPGTSTYVVSSDEAVNARSCPRLDCAIVATLQPTTTILVIETVSGDEAFDSTLWMHAIHNEMDIYVHSALLSAEESAATQADLSSAGISMDDWVEYTAVGIRVKAPPNMRDFSNDTDFMAFSLRVAPLETALTEGEIEELVSAVGENNIFLLNPQTSLAILASAQYSGFETPLSIMDAYYEPDPSITVLRKEIVETGAGEAFFANTRTDAMQTETYEYHMNVDGVDVVFSITASLNLEGLPALAQAFSDNVEIIDPSAVREYFAQPVGYMRPGVNIGRFSTGKFQLWSYKGQANEMLTLEAVGDMAVPTGPDTRLVVRGPDGRVLASNDDSGAFGRNTNARIQNLMLPATGFYEIEVHAYLGYTNPAYQLLVEAEPTSVDLSKTVLAGLPG